jgi:hypothetical protein
MNQAELLATEFESTEITRDLSMPLVSAESQRSLTASESDAAEQVPHRRDQAQSVVPTLSPVWSRYIDSRLKQFCSR